MALADRVLVYGDCAVVPDPDRRAARRHRDLVGRDRRAVRHRAARRDAVVLHGRVGLGRRRREGARARRRSCASARPSCAVEGPIQYDAAADAAVARDEDARIGRSPAARRCSSSPTSTPATTPTRRCSARRARWRSGPCCRASTSRSTTSRAARSCRTSSTPSRSRRSRRQGCRRERRPRRQLGLVVDEVPADRHRGGRASLACGLVERIGERRGARAHTVRHPSVGRAADAADATYRGDLADPRPRRRLRASCSTRSPSTGPRSTSTRRSRSGTAWCTAAPGSSSRRSSPTLVEDQHRRARRARAAAQPGQPGRASSPREQAFPDVPHVAVFDTAFHQTLPPAAYTYAIDRELAASAPDPPLRVPRHVAQVRVATRPRSSSADRSRSSSRSCCTSATARRRAPSTAAARSRPRWGMTPLEGLVMGTRSGDIDPAVLLHLQRVAPVSTLDDARRPAQQAQRPPRARRARRHARPRRRRARRATPRRRSRSRCTCTASARMSAPTPPSSAGSTRSCSPRASARTPPSCAQRRSRGSRASASSSTRAERGARARHPGASRRMPRGRGARRAHERGARDRPADPGGRRRLRPRAAPSPRPLRAPRAPQGPIPRERTQSVRSTPLHQHFASVRDARQGRMRAACRCQIPQEVLCKMCCARSLAELAWGHVHSRAARTRRQPPTHRRRHRPARRRPDAGAGAPAAPAHPRPAARRGPAVRRRARAGDGRGIRLGELPPRDAREARLRRAGARARARRPRALVARRARDDDLPLRGVPRRPRAT